MRMELTKEDTMLLVTLTIRNIEQIYILSDLEELTEVEIAEFIHCNQVMDKLEGNMPKVNPNWTTYHKARKWYKKKYKKQGVLQ